ncbi:MAG: hypothetical protein WCB86_06400 [Candidatus Dormiibacterota bacterium]
MCPVCGERLAEGVLSRADQVVEPPWLDDLLEPCLPIESQNRCEPENPVD